MWGKAQLNTLIYKNTDNWGIPYRYVRAYINVPDYTECMNDRFHQNCEMRWWEVMWIGVKRRFQQSYMTTVATWCMRRDSRHRTQVHHPVTLSLQHYPDTGPASTVLTPLVAAGTRTRDLPTTRQTRSLTNRPQSRLCEWMYEWQILYFYVACLFVHIYN